MERTARPCCPQVLREQQRVSTLDAELAELQHAEVVKSTVPEEDPDVRCGGLLDGIARNCCLLQCCRSAQCERKTLDCWSLQYCRSAQRQRAHCKKKAALA